MSLMAVRFSKAFLTTFSWLEYMARRDGDCVVSISYCLHTGWRKTSEKS